MKIYQRGTSGEWGWGVELGIMVKTLGRGAAV
jgi:hypothetical protein